MSTPKKKTGFFMFSILPSIWMDSDVLTNADVLDLSMSLLKSHSDYLCV